MKNNQAKKNRFDTGNKRYSLFPIQHEKIWEFYKKAEASFWTFEEIDLSQDLTDFKNLSKNERFFIKKVLSFFAVSDGLVNENLLENFGAEVHTRGSMFLRVPNCNREHPRRNLLATYRFIRR